MNNWETTFRKKWGHISIDGRPFEDTVLYAGIVEFIHSLLSRHRQEWVGKIEGMKKQNHCGFIHDAGNPRGMCLECATGDDVIDAVLALMEKEHV